MPHTYDTCALHTCSSWWTRCVARHTSIMMIRPPRCFCSVAGTRGVFGLLRLAFCVKGCASAHSFVARAGNVNCNSKLMKSLEPARANEYISMRSQLPSVAFPSWGFLRYWLGGSCSTKHRIWIGVMWWWQLTGINVDGPRAASKTCGNYTHDYSKCITLTRGGCT